MLVLSLAICIAGLAAALLPTIPTGTKYWAILLTLSVLYPITLGRTFKTNRADKEFRVLHWFPAGIFILWFILQLIGPRFEIIRILTLGFFFLWSLPLVALGITFIIIFAFHVIRRSRFRVTILAILLAIFTAGALYAEAARLNPRLQASIFPKNSLSLQSVEFAFQNLWAWLGLQRGSSGVLIAVTDGLSSSRTSIPSSLVTAMPSSSLALSSSAALSLSFEMPASFSSYSSRSVLPPVIGNKNPGHLTQSGSESAGLLGATLLATYFGRLHARAKKRA